MHSVHRVCWKALKGFTFHDLANSFQNRLLFASRFLLFRAAKTSLSAMARLLRLHLVPC